VDGLTVRERIPNQSSISASLTDYTFVPGVREIPLSAFDPVYVSSIKLEKLDNRTRKLANEIKKSGEINPLIVVMDSEGLYVLEGGHRFDALIALGAKSLPAQVVIDDEPKFKQKASPKFSVASKLSQKETTKPIWYSELIRQIDALPQQEMTAAEWKALLVKPAETKTRGVREGDAVVREGTPEMQAKHDAIVKSINERLAGDKKARNAALAEEAKRFDAESPPKTETVESAPAGSLLPNVKMQEIKATEILEWLDAQQYTPTQLKGQALLDARRAFLDEIYTTSALRDDYEAQTGKIAESREEALDYLASKSKRVFEEVQRKSEEVKISKSQQSSSSSRRAARSWSFRTGCLVNLHQLPRIL
jgi:hypothetical protein